MLNKICLYLIDVNKKNTQNPFLKREFGTWGPINTK